MDAGKAAISSLVALLKTRCAKGIFDKDPDVQTNFGFIGLQCVQIDTGRFRKDELERDPAVYRPEIVRITDKFNRWLSSQYPELSAHLELEIAHAL